MKTVKGPKRYLVHLAIVTSCLYLVFNSKNVTNLKVLALSSIFGLWKTIALNNNSDNEDNFLAGLTLNQFFLHSVFFSPFSLRDLKNGKV